MNQPAPAPKQPRPIRHDPKAGHFSVVVAFTLPPHPGGTIDTIRGRLTDRLQHALGYRTPPLEGLSVAVRVIGAGSEKSEHEGMVGLA